MDLVQSQIRIAGGASLADLGLGTQADVPAPNGYALQCRITCEDPERGFQPDAGRISAYRSPGGPGIRLDGAMAAGNAVSRHYDSLLVKVVAHADTYLHTVQKMQRALYEFHVRGVKTNILFLENVLRHPEFLSGAATTSFIERHPALFNFSPDSMQSSKLLTYLAGVVVNGAAHAGAVGPPPAARAPKPPLAPPGPPPPGWRDVLLKQGPQGWAKAVRAHEGLLLTDTTWRDAHQSLLATRVRTHDLVAAAPATAHALAGAASLEVWGGATFDVALRFLHECPWARLDALRAAVPNVPFQMLLRGANAVGYTSYADNVVKAFAREAHASGVDIFRVFDSLNYRDNLLFGIEAVLAVGGGGGVRGVGCGGGERRGRRATRSPSPFLPGPGRGRRGHHLLHGRPDEPRAVGQVHAVSGRGGERRRARVAGAATAPHIPLLPPPSDYYLAHATDLVDAGAHTLAVKDMAGLLKPRAATTLVTALRAAFPHTPIHVHTHDTAGTGVATALAAAAAGADIVDGAVDSMAGTTSQPSLGAIVAATAGTPLDTGVDRAALGRLASFWEGTRALYAPFESDMRSPSADVYDHEMPGGQYTNLKFQVREDRGRGGGACGCARGGGRPRPSPPAGRLARVGRRVGRGQDGVRGRQPGAGRHRQGGGGGREGFWGFQKNPEKTQSLTPPPSRSPGHALVQGRGRPGPVHGGEQARRTFRRRPRGRTLVPLVRRGVHAGRHRPARGRFPGAAALPRAQGRAHDRGAAGREHGALRPGRPRRRPAGPARGGHHPARRAQRCALPQRWGRGVAGSRGFVARARGVASPPHPLTPRPAPRPPAPPVFDEFKEWEVRYSRFTAALPTRAFLAPLR